MSDRLLGGVRLEDSVDLPFQALGRVADWIRVLTAPANTLSARWAYRCTFQVLLLHPLAGGTLDRIETNWQHDGGEMI